jgi:hypothetical protein
MTERARHHHSQTHAYDPDTPSQHHLRVVQTEHQIERILDHNPYDFGHVYKELHHLQRHTPSQGQFHQDLDYINTELHRKHLLPGMYLIEDDHVGRHHRVHRGYDVVADDPQLQRFPGNHTIISTSHHAPRESAQLRRAYGSMHFQHGHYNGWNQSVIGGGGADGGYNRHAVRGHIPEGARKELIDQALQLCGLPATAEYESAVDCIVQRESGWNPNITNNWDSNYIAGHPSTGLMQTIPETFRRWALVGYDDNINDPLSNLIAGIRYAQHRYGNRGGILYVASRPGGY